MLIKPAPFIVIAPPEVTVSVDGVNELIVGSVRPNAVFVAEIVDPAKSSAIKVPSAILSVLIAESVIAFVTVLFNAIYNL